MSNFDNSKPHYESVFSKKISGGRKRTYFIDVKKTKTEDLYIVLSENSNKPDGSVERHRIFLYKEDLNRFLNALNESSAVVKQSMPDYDFDQYDGRFDTIDPNYVKPKPSTEEDAPSW